MISYRERSGSSRCAVSNYFVSHVSLFVILRCCLLISNLVLQLLLNARANIDRWWWRSRMRASKCWANRPIGWVKFRWEFTKSWVIRISKCWLQYDGLWVIFKCYRVALLVAWSWLKLQRGRSTKHIEAIIWGRIKTTMTEEVEGSWFGDTNCSLLDDEISSVPLPLQTNNLSDI